MAGAANRNTLEVLPQNGLVGGFDVEDDGLVGERLELPVKDLESFCTTRILSPCASCLRESHALLCAATSDGMKRIASAESATLLKKMEIRRDMSGLRQACQDN